MSSGPPPHAPGELTPEQLRALESHAARWVENALSTQPVVAGRLVPAVHALYAAAALKPPRVVVVSSPVVMVFAAGFAAAIWWARENNTLARWKGLAWDTGHIRDKVSGPSASPSACPALEDAIRLATEQALPPTSDHARNKKPPGRHGVRRHSNFYSRCSRNAYAIGQPLCVVMEQVARDRCTAAADKGQRVPRFENARELTELRVRQVTQQATLAVTNAALYRVAVEAAAMATRAEMDHLLAPYRAPKRPKPLEGSGGGVPDMGGPMACAQDEIRQAIERALKAGQGALAVVPLARRFALLAYDLGAELGIDFHLLLAYADLARTSCQGGNMDASADSYLSACRDVLGLVQPEHEKYRAWESCATEGSLRIVHDEFCIVSDRPEVLKVDGQNRPHCADGPSHRWRDGWSLYHWHGTHIPPEYEYIILAPAQITVAAIDSEPNAEMRRVMMERYGADRYAFECGATVVEELPADHPIIGLRSARLLHKPLKMDRHVAHLVLHGVRVQFEALSVYVDLLNSTPEPDGTVKRYLLRVDPSAYGGDASRYVHAAVASTWRNADGSLTFSRWQDYNPDAES